MRECRSEMNSSNYFEIILSATLNEFVPLDGYRHIFCLFESFIVLGMYNRIYVCVWMDNGQKMSQFPSNSTMPL